MWVFQILSIMVLGTTVILTQTISNKKIYFLAEYISVDSNILILINIILISSFIYFSIKSNNLILELSKSFYKKIDITLSCNSKHINFFMKSCLLDLKDFSIILPSFTAFAGIFIYVVYLMKLFSIFLIFISIISFFLIYFTNNKIILFSHDNYFQSITKITNTKNFKNIIKNRIFFILNKKIQIYNMNSFLVALLPISLLIIYSFSNFSIVQSEDIIFLIIISALYIKFNLSLISVLRRVIYRNSIRLLSYDFFINKNYSIKVKNENEDIDEES